MNVEGKRATGVAGGPALKLTLSLAALALFVFGTGVMNDLSFTFIVGIITGTFSSIFIASPIFYWWHKGDRKHVESA